jgi:hypothetical protein
MQLLYETGLRPSAYIPVLEATDDPDLRAMGLAGANAMPMPNIPEMGSVWRADNGITLAITGEQTAEEAMADAAEQVRASDSRGAGGHGEPARHLPGPGWLRRAVGPGLPGHCL